MDLEERFKGICKKIRQNNTPKGLPLDYKQFKPKLDQLSLEARKAFVKELEILSKYSWHDHVCVHILNNIRIFMLVKRYEVNPEAAEAVIRNIRKAGEKEATPYMPQNSANNIKMVIKGYNELEPVFAPSTYDDFGEYFMDFRVIYEEPQLGALETLKAEKEFLHNQRSETVFPLTMILTAVLDEHKKLFIKSLSEPDKINLAKAYGIAKQNKKDYDENYLEVFYKGLDKILEQSPDKIGRWAESIVKDFKRKSEKGLLKVLAQ